ncbi:hypothetical protein QR680_003946 [Steinernema hermaphroditum]|uniref:DNA-directed DNA polymerase n=1 Tax=Steinernema hermaphroditum TaxID=289476 RepID=A0AA39LSY8_9BILA|nr:hypothetical protein QR680_003946 [Steinernema hermaphroditum]
MTPVCEITSLDEAYMDITDYLETRTQTATVKRVRYKGNCICRLPLIQDGDTVDEGTCTPTESKCKKMRKTSESHRKSISVERMFQPQENIASLLQIIEGHCDELINSLSSHGIEGGRSATLKIKFASFDSITRCVSVDFLISTAEQFYPIMESTLKKECDGKVQMRLLGVRLSKLEFTDSKNANQSSKQRSMAEYLKAKKEPVDDEQDEPKPSTSSSSVGQCPICAKPLPVENSIAVNRHIDECLNRSALEEMPKNERKRKSGSGTKTVQPKKRRTILSYFGKLPETDGDIEIQ